MKDKENQGFTPLILPVNKKRKPPIRKNIPIAITVTPEAKGILDGLNKGVRSYFISEAVKYFWNKELEKRGAGIIVTDSTMKKAIWAKMRATENQDAKKALREIYDMLSQGIIKT